MKTFGEVIAEVRQARGLTQKVLAAQLKKQDGGAIGLAYLNDIEHDRRNPPALHFVAQLADVLGVPDDVLRFYVDLPRFEGHSEKREITRCSQKRTAR